MKWVRQAGSRLENFSISLRRVMEGVGADVLESFGIPDTQFV
jgi:hypothetical protein